MKSIKKYLLHVRTLHLFKNSHTQILLKDLRVNNSFWNKFCDYIKCTFNFFFYISC